MDSLFQLYFKLGLDHIADVNAYDHIVFVIALCAVYRIEEWRKIAILVTAFTVGHSITLALAALNIIQFPKELIEFLIPLTILITSIHNVIKQDVSESKINWKYLFALFFGLIHGMGFSSYFRSLMMEGESIVQPLFAFNVGIEAGQLSIVIVLLLLSYFFLSLLKIKQKDYTLFVSGLCAGIAIILMLPFFS